MNITVYRHEAYNKYLIIIDRGYSIDKITLYDISTIELAEFIKTIAKEDE